MNQTRKYVYLGSPHTGGTYTVYASLRQGLAPLGIEVTWLAAGPKAARTWEDEAWQHERAFGAVVAPAATDAESQGRAIVEHLESAGIDGVFVGSLTNRTEMNSIRYLRQDIRRILIVHNITLATYRAASALRPHVHATVGVAPRLRDDLIKRYGFNESATHFIGNGIDMSAFLNCPRLDPRSDPRPDPRADHDQQIKLLSLGRVLDEAKGVFWLPRILAGLGELNHTMTVGGDGPDLAELKRRCEALRVSPEFLGRVGHQHNKPLIYASNDVFLLPSRFEGFGITLIEAMAAGCVPVASRIQGVTDWVIQDGQTGLVFPIGATDDAAALIRRLANDPAELKRLSHAARADVQARFSIEVMARQYAAIIDGIEGAALPHPPLPLADWQYPREFLPGLRRFIPPNLKKLLRRIVYR